MKPLVTAAQMKVLEQLAEQRFGMPASLLMENAGGALAEHACQELGTAGRVVVLCGRGNNGGDGLVAARRLAERGVPVQVELVGGPAGLKGDPERNARALAGMGLRHEDTSHTVLGAGDVVIDALLGTGVNRGAEGEYADKVHRIARWREAGAKVVAADLPTGLDADTGRPYEPCVRADVTVSFGALKRGQAVEPGASICGRVVRVDIGLPCVERPAVEASLLEEEDARAALPLRTSDSNKGTYGHVLVIAGGPGKSGAAAMSGIAALRTGAGLVTVATRPQALDGIMSHAPELMGAPVHGDGAFGLADLDALAEAAERKHALVIGPGIPRGPETGKLLRALLEKTSIPAILDADALNAAAEDLSVLEPGRGRLVLTPHPGEMGRLVGKSAKDVQADRIGVAQQFARTHGVVLVLKGARTLIATPDGNVRVNPTGNPGMATGGTGDVLSGMIGALLGQGLTVEQAACTGVYAHGLAGDKAAQRTGQLGLIATDLFVGLQEVWTSWGR